MATTTLEFGSASVEYRARTQGSSGGGTQVTFVHSADLPSVSEVPDAPLLVGQSGDWKTALRELTDEELADLESALTEILAGAVLTAKLRQAAIRQLSAPLGRLGQLISRLQSLHLKSSKNG
jgi:hypothetical protein